MEDVDRIREVPGSASAILHSLEDFGFHWDGEVIYQSQRNPVYAEAIEQLQVSGLAYPCSCSRKEIREQAKLGAEGPIYPGTCRPGPRHIKPSNSIRLLTQDQAITIHDRVQGPFTQNPGREVGDFVIRRADGFHAYQLAVVIDDAWQRITHVVRGTDLLSSTPRQYYLQRRLGLAHPCYLHLPLAVDGTGRKLSKQDQVAPVDPRYPIETLLLVLRFLQQPLPPEKPTHLDELWAWSITHWCPALIPVKLGIKIAT
jgi:glutamyl-Q tRNA(Asp) synthetase